MSCEIMFIVILKKSPTQTIQKFSAALPALNHWKMKENMKRFRNRSQSTEQNYFDRLPTELIISIFERITDAKSLCICYSVCKYFATHVVQTRFVSVEIPYAIGDGEVPIWPPGFINFLKKLCCVESAAIQFCPRMNPSTSQPLVWWKSDSSGFFFVFAESHGIASVKATRGFTRGAWFYSIENPLLDFRLRFLYVKELVLLIPNLKHISAADSMKQGSIVVEEQGIASMKNKKKKNPSDDGGKLWIKSWVSRKVKLSFSGCVMKNVVLICDGLTAENLSEENHEYREVAMTMMRKPPSSHITVPFADGFTIADRLHILLRLVTMFLRPPRSI